MTETHNEMERLKELLGQITPTVWEVIMFREDDPFVRASDHWVHNPGSRDYQYQILADEEYDFQRQKPQQTFREMFVDNPKLFKLNMPADAVFLNRIGFGLVSLQTEIGATLNCYRYATSYFQKTDPDWSDDPWRERSFHAEIPAERLLD